METPNTTEKEWFNVKQAAEYIGCNEVVMSEKCRKGHLKASKRFGKWFIFKSDLIEYLHGTDAKPTNEPTNEVD